MNKKFPRTRDGAWGIIFFANFFSQEILNSLQIIKLNHLIEIHPNSKIIVLNNFRGVFKEETADLVSSFNNEHGTDIFYIDSSDWVPAEPLHPLRDGHKIIAEHLTEILKEKYSL